MDAQFEHLCRICAANTKSKNNSVVESVFIFKTVGLKDKIARHLYLNVAENDPLPKVLCKSCYRQVEATASLSNIAKHTQRVFRDFLLSTVPKHAREATAALLQSPPAAPPAPTAASSGSNNNNKSNNSRHSGGNNNNNSFEQRRSNVENCDEFRPIVLSRAPETTITLAPPRCSDESNREEVSISLTKKDNEMRQPQQQQQQQQQQRSGNSYSQSQAQAHGQGHSQGHGQSHSHAHHSSMSNSMPPSRRSSVYVDTRYGSTPMSIAQRSMQQLPSLVPLHPEVTLSKTTKSHSHSPEKKPSPAGVINFIQTHGRITGNAPTTTISTVSGDKSSASSNSSSAAAPPPPPPSTISSGGVLPNLPSSVLQQKRRNLKNALNNIKAINQGGQVSLLKSSQPRQPAEEVKPYVTTTVVPHKSLYGAEPSSVEEALPEHIIIAAPKKKKEEQTPQSQSQSARQAAAAKLQKIAPKNGAELAAAAPPAKSPPAPPSLATTAAKEAKAKIPPSMTSLTEAISLGNVIRDPDLLKLILNALKWPVTIGNCEEQMTRLKNSKFAVIMSDSNLLQDNDLTQLLGPYLGPMLAVAQQQQKQKAATVHKTPSKASPSPLVPDLQSVADLASAMPYKLPPDTSVQLVPSSPTEPEPPQPLPLPTPPSHVSRRPQRKTRTRDSSLVIAEEQPPASSSSGSAAHVTNELLNINAMLISQYGANPADMLNEALISMLKQQQETKSRRQSRRRRSASVGINLEDIVLMEPQPDYEPAAPPPAPPAEEVEVVSFQLPTQKQSEVPPPITRPNIKRRKQQREAPVQVVATAKEEPLTPTKETGIEEGQGQTSEEVQTPLPPPSAAVEEQTPSAEAEEETTEAANPSLEAPTSTVPESAANNNNNNSNENVESQPEEASGAASSPPTASASTSISASARKSGVKSALGQKLLEAIGLQQLGKDVPPESSRDTLRSALKRSLKQAQEQQQQLKRVKQEEPVKQLADSTTKPGAGEAAEEHKKAIAERELALLKRKTKISELDKSPPKDEKSERTDVSSSSSRNRRNRRSNLKPDANEEDSATEEKRSEPWDEDDDLPLKAELDKSPDRGSRPTRTSKTMSKYYKSPGVGDKAMTLAQKSQHAMGTRSTRQR